MARIENPIFPEGSPFRGGGPTQGPVVLEKVLGGILSLLLTAGVVVFFLFFLYGGLTWISSGGDEGKAKEAKQRLTQALVGLFLLFSAFVILKLVGFLFGLDWLEKLQLIIPRLS